ncbi:MAG: enoyl-CoA hydratase/isomerase family protein [Thermodesulfobacteriota bacterium]
MMNYQTILYEIRDKVAVLSLNRPDQLNAINEVMLEEFYSALEQAENDDSVTALILKGEGTDFSVGYDLREESVIDSGGDLGSAEGAKEMPQKQRRRQEILLKLARFPKSTIAQVQGRCLEMGCSLIMACDISFAAEDAQFGEPSVRFGQTTDMPLWYYLVGVRKAKELLLTGKTIDGKEAESIGLITKAVPSDLLESEVNEMALTVSLTPFDGLTNNREGFQTGIDARGLAAGWRMALDRRIFGIMRQTGRDAGGFDFKKVRSQKGWKAALEEMNAPYERFGY